MNRNILFWLLVGGGLLWWWSKQRPTIKPLQGDLLSSGLGVGGRPRRGRPKTEAERLATHRARFGTESLPPRGTGLTKRGLF